MSCESVFTAVQKPTTISDRLNLDTLSSILFSLTLLTLKLHVISKRKMPSSFSHFLTSPLLLKIIVIPLFKLLDCRKPKNKPHYLVKRSELISDKDIYIYLLIKFFFVYFVRFVNKPAGNVGLYDPAEIHNRHELKGFLKEAMIKLGFHLVFFFLYLYR